MEGNRRIYLIQPGPEIGQDEVGEVLYGPETRHGAWATRAGGRSEEGVIAATERYTERAAYTFRWRPGLRDLDPDWCMEEAGTLYDIEAVHEPVRRMWYRIIVARRG